MSLGMSLEELLELAAEEPIFEEPRKERPAGELFSKGVELLKAGRALPAAAHFLAVTLLEPDNSKAWNNLGIAWSRLKEWAEAKKAFLKALEVDPSNELARENLKILEIKLKGGGDHG